MDITIKDAQTIVVHPAHMGKAFYHSNMPVLCELHKVMQE